jgi:tight adherence protein C
MDVSRCKENFGMTLTIILIAAITLGLLKRRNHNPVAQQLVRQLPEFIDAVVLLMFSGSTPAQALIAAPTWLEPPLHQIVNDVAQQLSRGNRFSECVTALRGPIGPPAFPLVEALLSADRDGQSIASVLDRLSNESRAQRRRQLDADIRRLPVRLTIPLVCCILPSFVLLGVVPMIATALVHLGRS